MAAPTEHAEQLPHFFWWGCASSAAPCWPLAGLSTSLSSCAICWWQGGLACRAWWLAVSAAPPCWLVAGAIPCAQVIAAAANPWKGMASSTNQTSRVRASVFTGAF